MFEDIPLIYMNIRILQFWSLLYDRNWKLYLSMSLSTFLVFTQLLYMLRTQDGIDAIIRNSYMLVLWFNTILRAYMLLHNHEQYEVLIGDLVRYYNELKQSQDRYIQRLLDEANATGRMMARGNLFLGLLTCIGFGCYPLFAPDKVLPFGISIPGIDEYETPYYQLLYVYQMVVTPMGCCMYIPFTSLIVAFIMFGIVMCKSLQHRLRTLHTQRGNRTSSMYNDQIVEYIKYQKSIDSYIATVNRLTTFIFLLEFLAFGTLLCALLFLLIIVDSTAQAVIICAYITMIFSQILALYWYANELREQNLAIADAAYDTEWFTMPIPVQKYILLMILRAQRPRSIMVGNIEPMTLELFQALLNASYTYFTLLKRVYG